MSTQPRVRGSPCSQRKPPIFHSFFGFQLTFDSITTHPDLNFTVVVNPASGPGPGSGPDANYTKEIPRLNSYANVRTVGYVSTDWSKRDVGLALEDISTYSTWSENSTAKGIGMHGIFLDETPTEYNSASARYYETIASAVRSETGLGEDPLVRYLLSNFPFRQYPKERVKQQRLLLFQSGIPRI
jgi:hypothetical protein